MAWQNYKDLNVWIKAMMLTDEVYDLIDILPKVEWFALASQMRRAVVSVPSNIAEGSGRSSAREFMHYLSIAKGSIFEIETQILICIRRQYFSEESANSALMLCDEVSRMITGLILHLDSKTQHSKPKT